MAARASAASDLGRSPPTEPRSMRRNITPPPPKRSSTAYRPLDRRTQHDLYRPSSYTPVDGINRGRRISIPDVWRPGPNHYADATTPGSGPKPPSARPSEHVGEMRARRSRRESPSHERFDGPRDRREHPSLSPSAQVGSKIHVARPTMKVNGQINTAAEETVQWMLETQETGERSQTHSDRLGRGMRDLNNDGERATASSFAPSPTGATIDVTATSTDFAPKLSETEHRESLPLPFSSTEVVTDHAPSTDFIVTEQRMSTMDTILSTYLQFDKNMSSPNDKNSGSGASKWPATRLTTEDTASNSSTTNSRNRLLCRECRTPGSSLTPLVACTSCGRGYHHSCGNPKPPRR